MNLFDAVREIKMKASLVEFVNAAPVLATTIESSSGYKADLEKLAVAVAQNAQLNTEVDRKIAANLLQAREEIVLMKGALESLRQQFENLTRGMAQVLEVTRSERLGQPVVRKS
jgi:DNA anti-recombination protein RmuC